MFSSVCPNHYFSDFWNGIKGDERRAKPLPLMEWKKSLSLTKDKRTKGQKDKRTKGQKDNENHENLRKS